MGIIVNKNNQQDTELSRRISADLREKALRASGMTGEEDEMPDFVGDAEYMKDLKKTGRFGWIWIVLVALAILSVISIVFL